MKISSRHRSGFRAGAVLLAILAIAVGATAADLQGAVTEGKEEGTAMAQDVVEARNKQAVRNGFDAWRKGSGSVYDLLAPDATWTIVGNSPVSRKFASRQEFLDVVITPFNARMSGRLVPTVRGVYAEGDMVVVLWDGEGTARDGKPYKNTYSWFLQMREGRIVNAVAFFDTVAFNDLWTRVPPADGGDG